MFSLVITAELINVRYHEQIRTYAIHRLSTGVALSPVEKVLLARTHRVTAWLVEGVTSLVLLNSDPESANTRRLCYIGMGDCRSDPLDQG